MPSSGLGMTVLYWSANLRKAQPGKAAKQRADMSWRTRNTCTCYHACQSPRDRQRSRSPQALTAVADGHLVVDEPATHTHTHTHTQYTHTHARTHTHTHTHTHCNLYKLCKLMCVCARARVCVCVCACVCVCKERERMRTRERKKIYII